MRENLLLTFLKKALLFEAAICLLAIAAIKMSGSNLAFLAFLNAGISSTSIFMIVYTMRFAVKGDLHQYPYGMGRLENAAEFSFHLLISLAVGLALIHIARELLHPPHHDTALSLSWVNGLYFLSAISSLIMFILSKKLLNLEDSSLIHTLHHTYMVRIWHKSCATLLIPLLSHLFHAHEHAHLWIDLGLSLSIGSYEFAIHFPKVASNFRALVDFPIKEDEQLKIMGLLARHFNDYDQIGRIYTTNKGSHQVVEVELEFSGDIPLRQVARIEEKMKQTFAAEFPHGEFRIRPIPLKV